jgi:uncharacterized protein YkwD
MARFSLLFSLSLSLVACGTASGERTAAACPTSVHVRIVRPRVVSAHAAPRIGRVKLAPSAAPVAPQLEQYNLDKVNEYRRAAGVPPLTLDTRMSEFARQGSQQLAAGGAAHAHYGQAGSTMKDYGFHGTTAENQASWPRLAKDADENRRRQIDDILKSMMSEGPGGGHHDNMLSPAYKRLGVGLVDDGKGGMSFTNDFSD